MNMPPNVRAVLVSHCLPQRSAQAAFARGAKKICQRTSKFQIGTLPLIDIFGDTGDSDWRQPVSYFRLKVRAPCGAAACIWPWAVRHWRAWPPLEPTPAQDSVERPPESAPTPVTAAHFWVLRVIRRPKFGSRLTFLDGKRAITVPAAMVARNARTARVCIVAVHRPARG